MTRRVVAALVAADAGDPGRRGGAARARRHRARAGLVRLGHGAHRRLDRRHRRGAARRQRAGPRAVRGDGVGRPPARRAAAARQARAASCVSQGVPPNGDWRKLVAQATQQSGPTTELTKRPGHRRADRLGRRRRSAARRSAPWCSSGPPRPLNQNIANLWLYLIGLGGAAMAAAVLIAIYFARWVSRPLARLDTAARKIADGDLLGPRQDRVRPARAAPDGRHLQHDGRAARGPGARAPGDARRRLAPAAHPADRAPAPPRPARRGLLPRRPRPSWPARRRRSPGCPGWSTGCSPPRGPRR